MGACVLLVVGSQVQGALLVDECSMDVFGVCEGGVGSALACYPGAVSTALLTLWLADCTLWTVSMAGLSRSTQTKALPVLAHRWMPATLGGWLVLVGSLGGPIVWYNVRMPVLLASSLPSCGANGRGFHQAARLLLLLVV
jgi:hypothetical protein